MIDRKKREAFYSLIIAGETKDFSLVDFLDNSSCDEICEIDLNTGKFRQFSSSEGKYFTPLAEATFKSIYDFTYRYLVFPEDVEIYKDLMDPDHLIERLESSPLPNFRFANFRYKLQNGEYRWVEQCIVTGENRGLKKGVIRLYVFDIQNLMSRRIGIVSDESNVISTGRDQVTGLYASKEFYSESERILKETPDKKWCVLFIDVEHFKFFNEWYS